MISTSKIVAIICICFLLTVVNTAAQDNAVVPDLTGLSVPEAAAALNRVGLALGVQTGELWTAESGLEQNRIRAQSAEPGTSLTPGSPVDVTVLRTPNVILIYDDNDLTLVNQTGGELNLGNIMFITGNGASFSATRWSGSLRSNQCTQIWSIGRNGPKGMDECSLIQNWLVTTNTAEHFWTGAGGAAQFTALVNGAEAATCPVANPGRCEFFVSTGEVGDGVTEYVYFAYTPDRLAIINPSENHWMPIGELIVRNNAPTQQGAPVSVGDPSLFGNPQTVANIRSLAPGQCLFFTNGSPDAQTPPQPCDVIAQLDLVPNVIFWSAAFPVESITDDKERSCPAATPGKLTLCVIPR
jgi:hypothetical protein